MFRIPHSGFTLVELIIVIALIGMVTVFSFPFFRSHQVSQILDGTADELYANIRRSQSRAMSGDLGSRWGIHWATGEYTLFAGDDYDVRDSNVDLDVSYPDSITIDVSDIINGTGSNPYPHDIVFEPLTGETETTGTVTVSSTNDRSETFSIHNRGQIEQE